MKTQNHKKNHRESPKRCKKDSLLPPDGGQWKGRCHLQVVARGHVGEILRQRLIVAVIAIRRGVITDLLAPADHDVAHPWGGGTERARERTVAK